MDRYLFHYANFDATIYVPLHSEILSLLGWICRTHWWGLGRTAGWDLYIKKSARDDLGEMALVGDAYHQHDPICVRNMLEHFLR